MNVRCKTPKCSKEHELTPPTPGRGDATAGTRAQVVVKCDACHQTYLYSFEHQPAQSQLASR